MSIFLVGGGPGTLTAPLIWDQFLLEVRDCAAAKKRPPSIAVVLIDHQGSAEYFLSAYSSSLNAGLSCQVMALPVRAGEQVAAAHLGQADGILVGGGPCP